MATIAAVLSIVALLGSPPPQVEAKHPEMTRKRILKNHGVRKPGLVIRRAKRAGLRLDHALAMLEKETGIPQDNIFGCDHGPGRAFCRLAVTKRRVELLRHSSLSNGIGWTQITYKPLVKAYGGKWRRMHRPSEQMKVGFRHLATLIRQNGVERGFARYNGSGPAAEQYGREAVAIARKWHRRLH